MTPTDSWTLVCLMLLVSYLVGIVLLRTVITPEDKE